jgi:protein phosphatase-4 regulatory subunit 3
MATIDTRRRVKHYVLNDARQWVDRGTGHVSWIYNDKQRSVSLIVKSESDSSILLEAKILLSIVYQRQQDTLIVWSDTNRRDLALSFQEKAGCDEIWEKICEVLGEDSSLDITSSRGSIGSGSGTNGNENLDESDDEQLESDINTSPNSDLPPCELNKLKDIRDFFITELPRKSKIYKERLASILESDSYIKKLIEIFHICEDLENAEGLNYLFEIFRSLFYLNKSSLLDVLLSDDLIMDVIGCLEYDPNKNKEVSTVGHQQVIRHREYITTKSNFKEIISFENSDLVNKIHQTYKVQYIQDVILPAPSVFEENSLTSLSSFIFLNKVEISNLIQVFF